MPVGARHQADVPAGPAGGSAHSRECELVDHPSIEGLSEEALCQLRQRDAEKRRQEASRHRPAGSASSGGALSSEEIARREAAWEDTAESANAMVLQVTCPAGFFHGMELTVRTLPGNH